MDSVNQHATSRPQDIGSAEMLFYFPQYPSCHKISKRVLGILLAFQIIDFCCILAVVTLVAITINLLKATALQADVAPNMTNVQGILVIATMSLPLLPLRIILWKRGIRTQPAVRFRLFATTIFGLSIILWSLVIFVLLVKGGDWGERLEQEKLNKAHVLRVCLP